MRPLHLSAVATLAVASLLPLATGAEAAVAAAGSATSTATLASVTAVGKTVKIGTLTAAAGNTSGILSKVTLAPLSIDGADVVPAITVEPNTSPKTVNAVSTPAALAAVLAISSPTVTLNAAGGDAPMSGLNTPDGLGSISILGMPLTIDGSLKVGSAVSKTKGEATKALTVTNLALPSLSDLLAALGIDLAKLPVDVLNDLVTMLPVAVPTSVQALIDDANDDLDGAQALVDTKMGELQSAQTTLNLATAANNAMQAAQTAFSAGLAGIPMLLDAWNALTDEQQQTLNATVNALEADLATKTAAAAAYAPLAELQAAVDTAQAALNAAIAAILPLVETLAGLVEGVLDTPIASLASANVGTLARVDATKVAQVNGSVSGLKVLGGDILQSVTGNSTLDLAGVAGSVVSDVNTLAQGVMDTLSSVLSGATGMIVPAPQVSILQKTTKTGVDGAFGTADASVAVLSISMEPITLPEEFALDEIADALPAALPDNITSITDGVFEATAFDISVGTLSEAARYRPATVTPGTGLPATGAPYGLGLLAATALGIGVLTRRSMLARAEA